MLFEHLPESFFLPLAGPNKQLYWECICQLYKVMNHQLSFGVLKEVVLDELQYVYETAEKSQMEDEGVVLNNNRDKASYRYRKFLECRWLSKEETHSYEERIHFEDYAIEIIKTLQHIGARI